MFSITLLAVGKLKERFYAEAVQEYEKRLRGYCRFQLVELPEQRLPEDPNAAEIAAGLAAEAARIRAAIPKGSYLCVFTPEGKQLSSEAFAEKLRAVKNAGRSAACFVIGSSFGLDPSVKRQAELCLSFSPMTFPHHLFRIMALEQLYRAETIQAGTKYHK